MKNKNTKKAEMYVITVDMGYGHQRATYPFLSKAYGGVINANKYRGIASSEQKTWNSGRQWYEIISQHKSFPIIGEIAFSIMDYFQKIESFYPRRDLSKNSSQQKYFYNQVRHGLGKNLINELNKYPLPILTSFFVPAYAAEYNGYRGQIYCIVCDADIARAWAPYDSKNSKINYLAPNKRVKERLILYGVRPEKIYVTGFPLPKENIGGLRQEILKHDLKSRLYNLDPRGIYRKKYEKLIEGYLCPIREIKKNKHPITVTFAVGGAGAQRELGALVLKRLKKHIQKKELRLNLIAGVRNDVYLYFKKILKQEGLENNKMANLLFEINKIEYFKLFNETLRTTDVLWTKPSELTFYSGLGIPIIMSEPIGSQEYYNREWLLNMGCGIDAKDPRYVDEWLMDWLNSGWLAEAAMQGYLDAPKMGTYHIENIVLKGKKSEIEDVHLL